MLYAHLIFFSDSALERTCNEWNDSILLAFRPYLVLIFKLAADSQDDEKKEKIARVPKIWLEKGIISMELAELLNCVVLGVCFLFIIYSTNIITLSSLSSFLFLIQ